MRLRSEMAAGNSPTLSQRPGESDVLPRERLREKDVGFYMPNLGAFYQTDHAATPIPLGDLTAQQCRDAAGKDFILSGGVSPDLWLPNVDVEVFKKAVLAWLALKKHSTRLIANAGDQAPPGADEERIEIMRDLVDEHGRY